MVPRSEGAVSSADNLRLRLSLLLRRQKIQGSVRDGDQAARCEDMDEAADDVEHAEAVIVVDEVQHRNQEQPDWLRQVQGLRQIRVGQDGVRLTQAPPFASSAGSGRRGCALRVVRRG